MEGEVAQSNRGTARPKNPLRSRRLRRGVQENRLLGAILSHSTSKAASARMREVPERQGLTVKPFCGMMDNACLLMVL